MEPDSPEPQMGPDQRRNHPDGAVDADERLTLKDVAPDVTGIMAQAPLYQDCHTVGVMPPNREVI